MLRLLVLTVFVLLLPGSAMWAEDAEAAGQALLEKLDRARKHVGASEGASQEVEQRDKAYREARKEADAEVERQGKDVAGIPVQSEAERVVMQLLGWFFPTLLGWGVGELNGARRTRKSFGIPPATTQPAPETRPDRSESNGHDVSGLATRASQRAKAVSP